MLGWPKGYSFPLTLCLCLWSLFVSVSFPMTHGVLQPRDSRFLSSESFFLVETIVELGPKDGGLDTLLLKHNRFGVSDTTKQYHRDRLVMSRIYFFVLFYLPSRSLPLLLLKFISPVSFNVTVPQETSFGFSTIYLKYSEVSIPLFTFIPHKSPIKVPSRFFSHVDLLFTCSPSCHPLLKSLDCPETKNYVDFTPL